MAKDSTARIWDKMKKDFGDDSFFRGNEKMKFKLDVIPFPTVALGSATGIWGAPKGKIVQFHGAEGSGKTFLAMLMLLVAQLEKGAEQVWIDTENSFSQTWAESLGIDMSRVHLIVKNNGAEIFTQLCGKVNKEGKKTAMGVFDYCMAGELNVNLVVLDSIADLQPPVEANRGFEEMEMAALARFLPRALRVLRPQLAKANAAMICINHLRDGMNGGQPSYPGGRAYRHNLDVAIKLHPCGGAEDTLVDSKKDKIGHKILATVEKCRFSVNKHKAEFWLDFTKGVVKTGLELAEIAAGYAIVERPNNKTWVYEGQQTVGRENFGKKLESDPKLMEEILKKVKKRKEEGFVPKVETEAILPDEVAEYADDGEEESEE